MINGFMKGGLSTERNRFSSLENNTQASLK